MVAKPFREGTIGEAPVLPGTGLFMPAGTAAGKDKGLFRRTVPEFNPDLCTGCLECALVCPDAAIPNSVHEIHELLLTGIDELDLPSAQRDALRAQVYPLSERVREAYRQTKEPRAFHELVAEAAAGIVTDQASLPTHIERLVVKLAAYPVARTRPFFDAMEKTTAGTGGLFAATIDPWKCTGCLECVEVCGPSALVARDQDEPLLATLQERFEFLSRTPNTAARFFEAIGRARRRHQAAVPGPRELLRDDRRPRRLPGLRRGHRHPPGHVDQPRDRRPATPWPARRSWPSWSTGSASSRPTLGSDDGRARASASRMR